MVRGNFAAESTAASAHFWCWCAQHPPLREVIAEVPSGNSSIGIAFMRDSHRLRDARPGLRVACGTVSDFPERFWHQG